MGCSASSASAAVRANGSSASSASAAVLSGEVGKQARRETEREMSTSSNSEYGYHFGKKIGRGSYAQVHFAIRRQTKVEVAVKVRNLHPQNSRPDNKVLKSAISEVALWSAVGTHVNCVQLLESFFDDHLAYMAMEKCDGSLFKYLQQREVVDERCMGKVFEHMLTGISHMHAVSVIHRDLKPDNFLVRGDVVKICDFGLSAIMPQSGLLEGIVGTAPYMPPEMLAAQMYDEKVDIWSFGVVAYMFLCGEFPYKTCDGSAKMMKRSILNGVEAHCGKSWLTTNAVNFLQEVLTRSPAKRPAATLALQLPFITNPDTTSLPSLHEVLNSAKQTGAFDSKDLSCVTETDVVLKRLRDGQLQHNPSFININVNTVSSTRPPQDAKGKIPNKMDEVFTPRSESTACGSSSYSSAGSQSSSKSRQ